MAAGVAVLPPTQVLITLIKGEDLANVEIGKEDPSVFVSCAYGEDLDPGEDAIVGSVMGETHERGGRNPDFEGEVLTLDLASAAEPGQQIWLKIVVGDRNGRREKPMGHGFVEISRLEPNVVVPMQVALTLEQRRAGVLEFTIVKRCPLAPQAPPPQAQPAHQPMMMVHGGTGMPPAGGGYFPGQPAPTGGAPPMGYPGGPPMPMWQQPQPPAAAGAGAEELAAQQEEMQKMREEMEAMREAQAEMAARALEAERRAQRAAEEAAAAEEEAERERLAAEAAAARAAAAEAEAEAEAAAAERGESNAITKARGQQAVGGPPMSECQCAAIFRSNCTQRYGPMPAPQRGFLQRRHLYGVLFGFRFIQIGTFRIGQFKGNLCVVHGGSRGHPSTSRCSMLCLRSGQPFGGPIPEEHAEYHRALWDRPITRVPDDVDFGKAAIRLGQWVIGTHDGTHLSMGNLSTRKNAWILKNDGSLHSGPRDNWPVQNLWNLEQEFTEGGEDVKVGDNNLDLGPFRIGTDRPDRLLFAFPEDEVAMLQLNSDGTSARSLRGEAGAAIAHDEHIPNPASGVEFTPCGINFGPFRLNRGGGRLSLAIHRGGEWRIIWAGHDSGEVQQGDGEAVADWMERGLSKGREHFPKVGDGFIDIGQFRFGDYKNRLVVGSTRTKKTSCIFRRDGEHFDGPFEAGGARDTFFRPFFERPYTGPTASVKFGQGFIELGNWRIGMHDAHRFAVTYNGQAEDE